MARRRSKKRDESSVAMLMDTPWQVSAVVAAVAFAVMRWIIPMQFKSVILVPIANVISGFAPITAIFFLFISCISFLRNRNSSWSLPVAKGYVGSSPFITDWSIELLRSLDWKRYELLCAEYFRILGKRVETIEKGADGGIDARIYEKDSDVLEYAIQCKSWNTMVGVKEIRELFGVMAHESAGKGVFMTTSRFSDDAKQFASEHKDRLFLVDSELFLSMLSNLPEEKRKVLLDFATEEDYTTPTCASCGIKMIRRQGNNCEFWGCRNFPKCRFALKISKS